MVLINLFIMIFHGFKRKFMQINDFNLVYLLFILKITNGLLDCPHLLKKIGFSVSRSNARPTNF